MTGWGSLRFRVPYDLDGGSRESHLIRGTYGSPYGSGRVVEEEKTLAFLLR